MPAASKAFFTTSSVNARGMALETAKGRTFSLQKNIKLSQKQRMPVDLHTLAFQNGEQALALEVEAAEAAEVQWLEAPSSVGRHENEHDFVASTELGDLHSKGHTKLIQKDDEHVAVMSENVIEVEHDVAECEQKEVSLW